MNILFVLEYYPPHVGGAEVLFKILCEGLASKGHDITVVTLRLPNTPAFEVINNVKVHRMKAPNKGARYWFTFLSIPKVFQLSRQADLIHTTTYNGAFPAWLAGKLRRKICVITVHEVFGSHWGELVGMSWISAKLHQLLERLIVALSFHKYISVSRYTVNCLIRFGVSPQKIAVVHSVIDYDLFNPEKTDGKVVRQKLGLSNEFVYMYYGRPGISKGVEYLVQAAPLIKKKIPNSKLLLILANDPKDRYENIKHMIKDLDIKDSVILLEPVSRNVLPNYIAVADCVVVPSLSEGFGLTAAEACAMGKPVVASNVASLPEVVSGKYVLVEPRSSEAIAEGVERVYKGETENSSRKIFSCDECVEGYLRVYQELVGDATQKVGR